MPPRGRKDASLLVPTARAQAPTGVYISVGRPLKLGEYELPPGVEVPGAEGWPRIEAWVNARRVRQARAGEEYVPFEEFRAQVDQERAVALEALAALEALEAAKAAEQDENELQGALGKE
jgi:hypothetical protein